MTDYRGPNHTSTTVAQPNAFVTSQTTSAPSSTSIPIRDYFGSSCESQATSNRHFQPHVSKPQPTHEHAVQSNHDRFGPLTQNNAFTFTVPHDTTTLFHQHAISFGKTTALNVQPSKLLDFSVPKHSFSHASSPLSIPPQSMSTVQHPLPPVHIIISPPAPHSARLPASPQPISISTVDPVPVEESSKIPASEADLTSMTQITKTSPTQSAPQNITTPATQSAQLSPSPQPVSISTVDPSPSILGIEADARSPIHITKTPPAQPASGSAQPNINPPATQPVSGSTAQNNTPAIQPAARCAVQTITTLDTQTAAGSATQTKKNQPTQTAAASAAQTIKTLATETAARSAFQITDHIVLKPPPAPNILAAPASIDHCDPSHEVPERPSSSVSKNRTALGSHPQPNQPHDSEDPTQNSLQKTTPKKMLSIVDKASNMNNPNPNTPPADCLEEVCLSPNESEFTDESGRTTPKMQSAHDSATPESFPNVEDIGKSNAKAPIPSVTMPPSKNKDI
ncbi:hypothetical protein O181_105474 [Austropuccinia psidii MF-1]|uniref:Uncharacterized protein n=1 Tax=Austropuccinia psidii MF-1 TaxID=1389203 RepID=A0A9Q3PL48_9BASI|nr:hypothetical protein [Austropuccinia psidii MF-1]